MTETVIRHLRDSTWAIEERPIFKRIGTLVQTGSKFQVYADRGAILTGVSLGPYSSMQTAMDAIAQKTGGICEAA
jgi:hypothetical protein